MKKRFFVVVSVLCLAFSGSVFARATVSKFPLSDALSAPKAAQKLNSDIKLVFGKTSKSKIKRSYGEFKSRKSTNAFNKSDKRACEWAFLSAMMSLQARAVREGGNAVVNIKSHVNNESSNSSSEYLCVAGNVVARVSFSGEVVTLK